MGPLYTDTQSVLAYLPVDLSPNLHTPIIQGVINRWSRYVDDYLASVYRVPFAPYPQTPGMITVITEMLTVYWLYVMSGMSSEKEDPRQSLWTRAHDLLNRLRSMEITIDKVPGGEDLILRSTSPLMAGPAKGAASLTNQVRELGYPHRKILGGPLFPLPDDEGV